MARANHLIQHHFLIVPSDERTKLLIFNHTLGF